MMVNMKLFGIGDGGCQIVNQLEKAQLSEVAYCYVNTDKAFLQKFPKEQCLLLGEGRTTNGRVQSGKQAAIKARKHIKRAMKDCDLIILCAGLGGGTGSGALPVFARYAKELNILTLAFVSEPFPFEGSVKTHITRCAVQQIERYADATICIDNSLFPSHRSEQAQAWFQINEKVHQGILALYELINVPMYINVDFADIITTLSEHGKGFIGVGSGKGKHRVSTALYQALHGEQSERTLKGFHYAILHICGSEDLTLDEVQEAIERMHSEAGQELDVIFGMHIIAQQTDEIVVTILASQRLQ